MTTDTHVVNNQFKFLCVIRNLLLDVSSAVIVGVIVVMTRYTHRPYCTCNNGPHPRIAMWPKTDGTDSPKDGQTPDSCVTPSARNAASVKNYKLEKKHRLQWFDTVGWALGRAPGL